MNNFAKEHELLYGVTWAVGSLATLGTVAYVNHAFGPGASLLAAWGVVAGLAAFFKLGQKTTDRARAVKVMNEMLHTIYYKGVDNGWDNCLWLKRIFDGRQLSTSEELGVDKHKNFDQLAFESQTCANKYQHERD
jgi:hypothetical protein